MKTKLLLTRIYLLLTAMVLADSSCIAQKRNRSNSDPPPTSTPNQTISENQSASEWKRYDLDGGNHESISVLLPSQPIDMPGGRFKVASGAELSVHLYLLPKDAKLYFALFVDLPKDAEQMSDVERGDIFYGCWRGVVARVKETLEEKYMKPFEIEPFPQDVNPLKGSEQRRQDFSVGTQHGRAQILFIRRRAYMLVGVWNPNDPVSEPAAFKFLDSFQVKIAHK